MQHANLETFAAVAEANGITTLAACIELVRAAGYTVTKPKPVTGGKAKPQAFRQDRPVYRSKRNHERCLLAFTFEDGTLVRTYALRENAGKAWMLGSAGRAACDIWRERNTYRTEIDGDGNPFKAWGREETKASDGHHHYFHEPDLLPCPALTKVEGVKTDNAHDTDAGELPPVSAFNEALAWYRKPMRARDRIAALSSL